MGGGRSVGDIKKIANDFKEVTKEAGKAKQAIGWVTVALGDLASKGVQWVGGKIVDGLKGATMQAVEFETALTDISKVTRGADDTAEGFARIKAGITDASKELGRMPKEIAELTAQLAPVFTDGKADLVELSKDVTKIGVAWGLTGKETGQYFADISRGLGLTAEQTKSLFGSINELSNKVGVNAGAVAEAVARSAGVLKASGLSEQTGAALNATLIAAGASAEVAATGVRTFVARLEAGEAATDKQITAFKNLGLDAKEVAHQMSLGGKTAEDEIKKVVVALGSMPKEDQISTLIQLFGSESIGSIGAAATAVDTLGKSFDIANDKVAAATSVQNEYNKVTKTSQFAIDKLKSNVSVLAIQFGEALLPHLNKISEFLTSPEGQEWGKAAVEGAIGAITKLVSIAKELWPVFSGIADVVLKLIDNFGGATIAAGLFAAKMLLLGGPAGALAAVAAIGVTVGYKLGEALFGPAETAADRFAAKVNEVMSQVMAKINEVLAKTRDAMKEQNEALRKENERKKKIIDAGFSDAEMAEQAKQAGLKARADFLKGKKGDNVKLSDDEAEQLKLVVQKAMADSKLAYMDAAEKAGGGGSPEKQQKEMQSREAKEARFAWLDANRKSLTPSQQKEYTKLSKDLDKRKTTGGGSKKPKVHYEWEGDPDAAAARYKEIDANPQPADVAEYKKLKSYLGSLPAKLVPEGGNPTKKLSKEDKALAGIDPMLADVLKGSDGGVSDDPLSKAVFGAATKAKNDHSVDGEKGSVGPGPNITNNYDNRSFNTNIQQEIDARGTGGPTENLAAAARDVGNTTSEFILTGWTKILADQNSGGAVR